MGSLKAIFDDQLAHITFDWKLAENFIRFLGNFINKNEDHMTFFGGHLTGVHIVKFTDLDRNRWFTDIMRIDELSLENEIHKLPSINTAFHVSSDIFNLTATYVIHRFYTSQYLNDDEKKRAVMAVGMTMNIKFFTSLYNSWFKYPANPEVAEATYAQLSEKFGLKQKGSWYALFEYRTHNAFDHNGIHYKKLFYYNVDRKIVETLNDLQGRIRAILKSIYKAFMEVSTSGKRISATSLLTIDKEGEQVVRDTQRSLLVYTRYIQTILPDANSFVKPELTHVIAKIVQTMPERLLEDSLQWMSRNYNATEKVDNLVKETLTHSFRYLSENRTVVQEMNNITEFVSRLRGVYTSSRTQDPVVFALRDDAEEIVKMATGTKNNIVIASVRTGLLIYICLRAFTRNYFNRGE